MLRLQVTGKMAHFRKYYANNTALSYFLPPRTTMMGMLAAMLGLEKDSYHKSLASAQIRIGVGILSPVKKSFHRLNLLKIKGPGDFRGKSGRVQTPYEIVSPLDLRTGMVRYVIYVSSQSEESSIFFQLIDFTKSRYPHYNLTLGTANFHAVLESIELFDDCCTKNADSESLRFHSAVNATQVSELSWDKGRPLRVEEELVPADFVGNQDREINKMLRIIYATDGLPLPVIYSGSYISFTRNGEEIVIGFLE